MKTRDMKEKYGIDPGEFDLFLKEYNLEHTSTLLGDVSIDDNLVDAYLNLYFDVKADKVKKQTEEEGYKDLYSDKAFEERKRVRDILEQRKETDFPVFELEGCRGRRITVFRERCIIKTDATLGAILTDNATDGAKTIFYKDVIGIQYKEPGFVLGYLQLETGSNQMNNSKSNMFSENTYTFDKNKELVEEIRDYITYQVSLHKQL